MKSISSSFLKEKNLKISKKHVPWTFFAGKLFLNETSLVDVIMTMKF